MEALRKQDTIMEEEPNYEQCRWGTQPLIPEYLFCDKDYNSKHKRKIYSGDDCLAFTIGNMCEWNMIKSKQELSRISSLFQRNDTTTVY